jgi:hypothetical protein
MPDEPRVNAKYGDTVYKCPFCNRRHIWLALKEILNAIYVLPREKEEKREKVPALSEDLLGTKPTRPK